MFVVFKKGITPQSVISVSFEVEKNEFHFENENYQFFIDSNLPAKTIDEKCRKIEGDNIDSLLNYLKKDGVLIAFHKTSGQIIAVRDESGLSSLYYLTNPTELVFSSNQHQIAQQHRLSLLVTSIQQWLTFDFLWDGQTFYQEVNQLLMDQTLVFNRNLEITKNEQGTFELSKKDNTDSEANNIKNLRTQIVEAHKLYVREKNVIFLSGGIDSVAMLIALDDLVPKDRIENHSFKVKSTQQDETEYAKSIADFLNTDLKIVERDISNEVTPELFRTKINRLNNPYPGIWIFANQITDDVNQIYYAGQDTRLHTPALNILDKIAFRFFELTEKFKVLPICLNYLMWPIQLFFDFITQFKFFKKRFFIGLKRASYIADTRQYILRYYFKLDKKYYTRNGIPESFFNAASKNYVINLDGIKTERELYNYVVSVKWKEQYLNDIRYMIDMVKDQGGRLAMPFYNMDLAHFSSTIPFKLANKSIRGKASYSDKEVSVNKFVLRQALRDKINDKTYFRAKAVSSTFHIIYNQALTKILRSIIVDDLNHSQSIIRKLDLLKFIDPFVTNNSPFEIEDGPYLLKIYELCCLVIYAEEVEYKVV